MHMVSLAIVTFIQVGSKTHSHSIKLNDTPLFSKVSQFSSDATRKELIIGGVA
jgi:hypothetical protein